MNTSADDSPPQLVRGLGLPQAIAFNIANMVGIGPFITIPLFIKSMQGPHAMIAWVIAALLVICDGLVWSELGAALPGSGGTYHFLKEIFGRAGSRWGRLLPFLFIWQFLISGTLEMASGYIGAADYLRYVFPHLESAIHSIEAAIYNALFPGWMNVTARGGLSWVAAALCLVIALSLCRRIETIGVWGIVLCAGTIVTVLAMIVSGLTHFNSSLLTLPEGAMDIGKPGFTAGLGAAMLIAIYDYLGYYNVCNLGDEVKDPGRTIPRAVIYSVIAIAVIYLTMNISIIAVVPWQQAMESKNIAADFMEALYGRQVAVAFTWLIIWTAIACMFAATLGYSRIPYAAAVNGDFFRVFARVHPTQKYPYVSLWVLSGLTAVFCFFPLQRVIDAAVVVRIFVQFIMQIVGLHVLRTTRPDVAMPFRMRLYPLPSIIALTGWIFVMVTSSSESQLAGLVVLASGVAVYLGMVWLPMVRHNGRVDRI